MQWDTVWLDLSVLCAGSDQSGWGLKSSVTNLKSKIFVQGIGGGRDVCHGVFGPDLLTG